VSLAVSKNKSKNNNVDDVVDGEQQLMPQGRHNTLAVFVGAIAHPVRAYKQVRLWLDAETSDVTACPYLSVLRFLFAAEFLEARIKYYATCNRRLPAAAAGLRITQIKN
jgi:hypothetical protein